MKRIQRLYDPLTTNITLQFSGSTVQSFEQETGDFYPDRTLVPLVAKPVMSLGGKSLVANTENISAISVTPSMISNIVWKKIKKGIESDIQPNDSLFVVDYSNTESRGSITIKENVSPDDVTTLIFTCKVIDPRNSQGIPFSIQFNIIPTKSMPAPTELSVQFPDGVTSNFINPITTTLTAKAKLQKGRNEIVGAKYWWYYLNGNNEDVVSDWVLLTDTHNVVITSGNTLSVPIDFIGKSTMFMCKAEHTEASSPSVNALSEKFKFANTIPFFEKDIISSSSITYNQETFPVEVEASYSGGVINNLEDKFDIEWIYSNGVSTNAILGTSKKIIVSTDKLSSSGYIDIDVKLTPKLTAKRNK